MAKVEKGFTLIELMIVVAIIAILASIALPTYQTYSIRAQVSEAINLAAPAKTAVASYGLETGSFPVDNSEAGLPAAASYTGNYVTSVTVDGADVVVLMGNSAHASISGRTITLTASTNTGSVSWSCSGGGSMPDLYLPTACK